MATHHETIVAAICPGRITRLLPSILTLPVLSLSYLPMFHAISLSKHFGAFRPFLPVFSQSAFRWANRSSEAAGLGPMAAAGLVSYNILAGEKVTMSADDEKWEVPRGYYHGIERHRRGIPFPCRGQGDIKYNEIIINLLPTLLSPTRSGERPQMKRLMREPQPGAKKDSRRTVVSLTETSNSFT
ncbi:UNVERIFIED_CONTAM: hypothetical protein Sangu_1253300 [Sesamum angustifolium]|uniref:Uncharacterized protein n=1 Tax=Sesamum angustifolium TaxID=2727405 RepID=A0AAW2NLX6_9LAMI